VDPRFFLGNNPLFSNLAHADLENLLAITRKKHHGARSIVVRQGDTDDDMYIIESGCVNVRLHLVDDEEITLGKLTAGDAFGEIALFDQKPRTASIVTCEPCEFLILSRTAFKTFLLSNPHVALQLLTIMSKRARATSDFLKEMMYMEITTRLGETLTNIAHAYGKNTPDGLKIDMKFADQELGKLAGIPCDTVTAQLRRWEKTGVIHKHFGYLTLLKPEELTRRQ
jgi:CRP/FNR family transcriptional regulator